MRLCLLLRSELKVVPYWTGLYYIQRSFCPTVLHRWQVQNIRNTTGMYSTTSITVCNKRHLIEFLMISLETETWGSLIKMDGMSGLLDWIHPLVQSAQWLCRIYIINTCLTALESVIWCCATYSIKRSVTCLKTTCCSRTCLIGACGSTVRRSWCGFLNILSGLGKRVLTLQSFHHLF